MGEPSVVEQNGECVLNDIDMMFCLSNNEVPECLKERLRYSRDDSLGYVGLWTERYEDIETGDFFEVKVANQNGSVFTSRTINTKAGEYKIISHHKSGEYCGSTFLINGRKTDELHFTILLKQQGRLSTSEDMS